ncbi:MAG: RluA family pseudouridine synthase [Myxococcales bacterium]|nr:RluA family pseudouridine synthase [Myxococcales bacterium]
MSPEPRFTVAVGESDKTLAAIVRAHGLAAAWSEAKRLAERGKLFVDGECITDPARRLRAGQEVELRLTARVPLPPPRGAIVHEDSQLVVLDKPSGISSVPFHQKGISSQAGDGDTAMDLIRALWRRVGKKATEIPLHVVHRIDKDTSGLIVFAKTKPAEKGLAELFRAHDVERTYLCVVHGTLTDRRIESRFIVDRGDGLRGSTRDLHLGKRAVTHVRVIEPVGPSATRCEVRLETGKTHQIRIHLAENGHPIVGEKVYIRDFVFKGGEPLSSPRLLLHAATLGFVHPLTGETLRFESALPEEFERAVDALKRPG